MVADVLAAAGDLGLPAGLRAALRPRAAPALRLRGDGRRRTTSAARQLGRRGRRRPDACDCRVLVAGVGALHLPKMPGPAWPRHRSPVRRSTRPQWRHDRDLTGQRVAVVGTGASAHPARAADRRPGRAARRLPTHAGLDDAQARPGDRPSGAAPSTRGTRWRSARSATSSTGRWKCAGTGFTVSPKADGHAEKRSSQRTSRNRCADPELRARLTPDYQIGCKRVLLSSDFYPALAAARRRARHRADRRRSRRDGIRDASGVERAVDTVVFAHRLRRARQPAADEDRRRGRASPRGRPGSEQGVNAHLGIMIAGFPNLFLLLGPNTGLGHNSVVFMIESQVAFVLKALDALDQSGGRQIDVRRSAQRRSVARGPDAGSATRCGSPGAAAGTRTRPDATTPSGPDRRSATG